MNNPAVAIRVYVGDAGLDTGRAQSVYTLDRSLIDQDRLVRKASVNLDVGQSTTLPGGTVIRFDGYKHSGYHAGQSRPRRTGCWSRRW